MESGGKGFHFGISGFSCCLTCSAFCCLAFKLTSPVICDKISGKGETCEKFSKFSLWLALLSLVAAVCLGCMTGELAPLLRLFGMNKHGHGGHNR